MKRLNYLILSLVGLVLFTGCLREFGQGFSDTLTGRMNPAITKAEYASLLQQIEDLKDNPNEIEKYNELMAELEALKSVPPEDGVLVPTTGVCGIGGAVASVAFLWLRKQFGIALLPGFSKKSGP